MKSTSLPASAATLAGPAWSTLPELVALGAIWGGSFLFMRIAAADFGPLALVEVRLLLGALPLLPFLWHWRRQLRWRHAWQFMVIGAFGAALPFTLFAWAAERAPAGIGAIANSMTVPFAVLTGFLLYRERIGRAQGLALIVGFIGVVVLMSGKMEGEEIAAASLAGVAAALCYGLAANFTRHWLAEVPPMIGVAGTLGCGTLALTPFALASWPTHAVATLSWASAIALGLVCTGFAYVLYFRLIQRVGAARAVTSTYLIPVFGVLWGWWLLAETPTASMLIAATLIIGSVVISQRVRVAQPAVREGPR